MQVVQVPNIQLNNLWIENVTRSKAMKEVIDVNVAFDTSFEDIELLRLEMERFVRSHENSRDFQPDIGIAVGGVGDCDKLTLKIAIKHKSNWHNDVVRATRRSKFMCALTLALKRVPINGPGGGGDPLGGPANPSYSVAVTDDFAAGARAKSEQDKMAKKLENQKPEESSKTTAPEVRAAEHINASVPVVENIDDWGYDSTLAGRDDNGAGATATGRSNVSNRGESQRGRRRAGETLPPHVLDAGDDGMPVVHQTRTSTSTRADKRSFDVERQAGMPPQAGSTYSAWATGGNAQSPPLGSGSADSAHLQPLVRYASPPSSTYLNVQQPGTAPQGAAQGRSLVGARARGASVSRPQEATQPGQGAAPGGAAPGPSRS